MIKGHSYSPRVRACCEGHRITYLLDGQEFMNVDYPFEPLKEGWPEDAYTKRLEAQTIRGWADKFGIVAEALELGECTRIEIEGPVHAQESAETVISLEVEPGRFEPIHQISDLLARKIVAGNESAASEPAIES